MGCEVSGRVRDAFAAKGHDAWSCDILPSDSPGNHIRGDVLDIIDDGWDLAVFHPPCTYLCNMGVWWNHKRPERWVKTDEAVEFARKLLECGIGKIALENPIGRLSTHIRKPDQVVPPNMVQPPSSTTTASTDDEQNEDLWDIPAFLRHRN